MSGIQTWLLALASTLLAQPELLVIAATAFAACALVIGLAAHLRHRRRQRPRQAASSASEPRAQQATPTLTPAADLAPRPHAISRPIGPSPLTHVTPASTSGPLAERGAWRHAPEHGAVRETERGIEPAPGRGGTAVLAPALDVAVAMPPAEVPLTVPNEAPSSEALAEQEYRRGLGLLSRQTEDREATLRSALACFRRAQEFWTRASAPERWAAIQNDIGRVYQELPSGDRAQHLSTAIMHHESALEVFDPATHPMNWAWTQAALGAAYLNNPRGSAIANARAAVAYYQRALDIFTPEQSPLAWAWNQNNLGAAYETMRGGAEGERVARLQDAATCYEAALRVLTSEAYPSQRQIVARNLERVRTELRALE